MHLVRDAQLFIRRHRWILERCPLQLYASALVFSPTCSRVRDLFEHTEPGEIVSQPVMERGWGGVNSHETSVPVDSVFLAQDSLMLAALGEEVIEIWDMETGQLCRQLRHEQVKHVAFSRDSKLLASASGESSQSTAVVNMCVNIWDLSTGSQVWALEGHTGSVRSISFAHDSPRLVSTDEDGTVRVWNLDSGDCEMELGGAGLDDTSILDLSAGFSRDVSTSLVVSVGALGVRTCTRRLGQWEWNINASWRPR